MKKIYGGHLREVAEHFKEKILKLKVILFDIDGILTDGAIFWHGEELGFNRNSFALDGFGLKILMEAGLKVGVISGGKSIGVVKRFEENLKLDYVFLGDEDKQYALEKILKEGYVLEEIFYMGDEFFDLPVLKKVGFSATVPIASLEIQEAVDYVTYRMPGQSPVRELVDIIRFAKDIVPKVSGLKVDR